MWLLLLCWFISCEKEPIGQAQGCFRSWPCPWSDWYGTLTAILMLSITLTLTQTLECTGMQCKILMAVHAKSGVAAIIALWNPSSKRQPESMNMLPLKYKQAESRILFYLCISVSHLIGETVSYVGWEGRQFEQALDSSWDWVWVLCLYYLNKVVKDDEL